jgi:hypothetical protein
LRDLAVRLGLDRVDEIRELNCVLNEEDRDVVANDVKVPLISVAIK